LTVDQKDLMQKDHGLNESSPKRKSSPKKTDAMQDIMHQVKEGDHDLRHVQVDDKSKPVLPHGDEIQAISHPTKKSSPKSLKEEIKHVAKEDLKPVITDDRSKPIIPEQHHIPVLGQVGKQQQMPWKEEDMSKPIIPDIPTLGQESSKPVISHFPSMGEVGQQQVGQQQHFKEQDISKPSILDDIHFPKLGQHQVGQQQVGQQQMMFEPRS